MTLPEPRDATPDQIADLIAAQALAMLDLTLPPECLAGVAAQLAALREQATRVQAGEDPA